MRRFKAVKGEVVNVLFKLALNDTSDIRDELLRLGLTHRGFALVGTANVVRCGGSASINIDSRLVAPGVPTLIIVIPLTAEVIK